MTTWLTFFRLWRIAHPSGPDEQAKIAKVSLEPEEDVNRSHKMLFKLKLVKIALMQDLRTCMARVTPSLQQAEASAHG